MLSSDAPYRIVAPKRLKLTTGFKRLLRSPLPN
jgi:hypothetical protein